VRRLAAYAAGYLLFLLVLGVGFLYLTDFGEPSTSALVEYASVCDVEQVASLLDEGADPNERNKFFPSAVLAAAAGSAARPGGQGCLETLLALVAAGGKVTRLDRDGDNFLVAVVLHQEDSEVVRYLIDAGVDPCVGLSASAAETYRVTTLQELAVREASDAVAIAVIQASADCSLNSNR